MPFVSKINPYQRLLVGTGFHCVIRGKPRELITRAADRVMTFSSLSQWATDGGTGEVIRKSESRLRKTYGRWEAKTPWRNNP